MNVAAAAAFSVVHLSHKEDTDDFFLQGLFCVYDRKPGTNWR